MSATLCEERETFADVAGYYFEQQYVCLRARVLGEQALRLRAGARHERFDSLAPISWTQHIAPAFARRQNPRQQDGSALSDGCVDACSSVILGAAAAPVQRHGVGTQNVAADTRRAQ